MYNAGLNRGAFVIDIPFPKPRLDERGGQSSLLQVFHNQVSQNGWHRRWESWKDWPQLRGLPTDPHSEDYLKDYSADYPMDYPHGLPLIINQIYIYWGKRHKKPTCSTYKTVTVWRTAAIFFSPTSSTQSFFIFAPFLHRPPTKTLCRSVSTVEYQSL